MTALLSVLEILVNNCGEVQEKEETQSSGLISRFQKHTEHKVITDSKDGNISGNTMRCK